MAYHCGRICSYLISQRDRSDFQYQILTLGELLSFSKISYRVCTPLHNLDMTIKVQNFILDAIANDHINKTLERTIRNETMSVEV